MPANARLCDGLSTEEKERASEKEPQITQGITKVRVERTENSVLVLLWRTVFYFWVYQILIPIPQVIPQRKFVPLWPSVNTWACDSGEPIKLRPITKRTNHNGSSLETQNNGGKVASKMVDGEDVRFSSTISFEQRFNCVICWAPNLRMIYGSCQHRLCENCLYDKQGNRRFGLERCPTCQRESAFPMTRPDIPEDNIEIQVQLGVRKCPNSRCKLHMWHWEIPDHLQ